jgi:hypothetical protein
LKDFKVNDNFANILRALLIILNPFKDQVHFKIKPNLLQNVAMTLKLARVFSKIINRMSLFVVEVGQEKIIFDAEKIKN